MKDIQKFENFLNEELEERPEIDNMKNVTSPRPNIMPTPQPPIRRFTDDVDDVVDLETASELNPDDEGLSVKVMFGYGAMKSFENEDYQQAAIDGTFVDKTFATEGEKEAYFQGCNDMSGNDGYLILTPEDEAKLKIDNINPSDEGLDFYENEE